MVDLFVRIELGGCPNREVYRELDQFMASLNWHRDVNSSQLPFATYVAKFDVDKPPLQNIATMLKAGIHSKIWPSALVLLVRAADWAASGTRGDWRAAEADSLHTLPRNVGISGYGK